jgi:ParB family transcriptional regulator, chromosome partitioning protein
MKTATATLAQLKLNPEINPRHIDANTDISDIKAQIRHKGCIGQLWVRAIKGNKFEIIDGGRRYRAMLELAKEGEWKKDSKIPVNVFTAGDAEAQDLALSANFPREALSPADEALGFTRLALSGMAVADIAAHYAVTQRLVQQRIAIGSLPEAILKALREGEIDIGAAQLFTAHSAEQSLKVFRGLAKKKSLSSYQVRHALEDGSISGHDRRCVFVGAAAYEAAAGVITRDLFSDHESWHDARLLDTLFEEKIASEAQALKDQGWSFVEVMRKNTHQLHSWGRSVAAEKRELTKDEKAELKNSKAQLASCQSEMEALNGKYEEHGGWSDHDRARFDELEQDEEILDAKVSGFHQPVYTARQMAKAGAVITVDEHGSMVKVIRGLIKPSKKQKVKGEDAEQGDVAESGGDPASQEATPGDAGYSEALTKLLELEAQKATKLAMVLNKPTLTARMGLAARIMAATHHAHDAPFQVHHSETRYGEAYEKLRDNMGLNSFDQDKNFAAIVAGLESLQPEEITRIEAYLAADTFTVSSLKNEDVKAVLEMIDPDMAGEGWKPDAEFFSRLNRAQLLAVIADCAPNFKMPASAKKAELVDEAGGRAQATGWLPPPLRTSHYIGPGSNAWAEHLASKSADDIAQQQAAE